MTIQAILEKINLGQIPNEQFFQNLNSQEKVESKSIVDYQKKWIDMIQWNFLFNHIDDHHSIIEIQGHGSKGITIIATDSQTQVITDLNLDEWKALLYYHCIIEKIAWNHTHPFVSFGSIIQERQCRITLIHETLFGTHHDFPKFFIRFHQKQALPLECFMHQEHSDFLLPFFEQGIKIDKRNIIICGPTGSGKTSLLNSLTTFIDPNEHIVTIEDTEELKIQHPKVTSFIGHHSGTSIHQKTMEDMCTYALRVTPDRMILGEIRGREIISLAMMINTGHKGVLTTVHASSAVNAMQRLTTLFCLYQKENSNFTYNNVLKFLSQQFHMVIYVENKKIREVIKIIAVEEDQLFFETLFSTKITS
jgi:type IV secretion system protein VirB11